MTQLHSNFDSKPYIYVVCYLTVLEVPAVELMNSLIHGGTPLCLNFLSVKLDNDSTCLIGRREDSVLPYC